jgi:hypothetical protein
VVARASLIADMHRYQPRPIRFHGLRSVDGWRLKRYSITYGLAPIDWPAFEPAMALVDDALPRPAVTDARPGVGFVIAHQGRTAFYCVLGWWDNENELPVRVFVRESQDEAQGRPARDGESFCVWDLQVIGFEREAYVATVLADGGSADGVRRYLGVALSRDAVDARSTAGAGTR